MAEADDGADVAVDQVEKEELAKEEEKANADDDGSESGDEPPPGEGLSEEIFEVERILDHTYEDDVLFFQVRWKNYTEDDDSWEPADNLASASSAIQAYWDSGVSKEKPVKVEKKSKKKKSSDGSSSKKAKSPKTPKPPKEKKKKKREETPDSLGIKLPALHPEEDEDDEKEEPAAAADSGSDDDYAEEGKKKNKVTKASVKAYDTPRKRGGPSTSAAIASPEISSARKAAMKHRSSWLYEDDDSDDDDEPKKKKAPPTPLEQEPKQEEAVKVEEPEEEEEEVKPVEVKKQEPVPEPRLPTLKIRLEKPSKVAIAKAEYLSPKLMNMEHLDGDLSIEGLVLNKNKSWQVLVKDDEGRSGIISAEVAFEKCGRELLQYMLDRAVFQR